MAPEVFNHSYTEKCDIWSAGIMLYIMLFGYPPFYGESKEEIKAKVMAMQLEFGENEEEGNEISEEAKDLIRKMLSHDDVRPTAEKCLQHPWFFMDKNMLS
jgi:calcium-dependent protein kinase